MLGWISVAGVDMVKIVEFGILVATVRDGRTLEGELEPSYNQTESVARDLWQYQRPPVILSAQWTPTTSRCHGRMSLFEFRLDFLIRQ